MIDLENLHHRYRELLMDDVVPFWFRHGIDRTHGGVLTCMNDDGTVVSGDKFIWSQARSVWTFSALYNRVEKRREFSRDFEEHTPYLPHSEMKVWWPHVEALYGTLLAHHLTGEPWRQRLDREGKPTSEIVALPVKDPFHLPRGIILILQLLKRMRTNQAENLTVAG